MQHAYEANSMSSMSLHSLQMQLTSAIILTHLCMMWLTEHRSKVTPPNAAMAASTSKWHDYYRSEHLPWDTRRPSSQLVAYLQGCPTHLAGRPCCSPQGARRLVEKPLHSLQDTRRLVGRPFRNPQRAKRMVGRAFHSTYSATRVQT